MLHHHHALFLTALGLAQFAAHADEWPRLKGDRSETCLEALALGQQAFRSTHRSLLHPADAPASAVRSVRVLGVDENDISGGDAIVTDAAEFDKLPVAEESSPRSVYWQRPAAGWRIVIGERAYGWRGDQYTVHLLPQAVTRAEFLQEWSRAAAPAARTPLLDSSWRPAAVYRSAAGSYWLLHPGEPYEFLAPWFVYTIDETGARTACSIEFRPAVKAIALLPPEVRQLEQLLDRTMGPGENEGTLQPTARLRIGVQHTWANVALRPWALGSPYNTGAETDAGLSAWAAQGASNRRLHAAVKVQVPLAQRALARYYAHTFHRTAADAAQAAAFAIDIAIRAHYTFHSEDPEKGFRDANAGSNPWGAPGAR